MNTYARGEGRTLVLVIIKLHRNCEMFLDIAHFVTYNVFSMVSFCSYTVVLWLKLESSSLTSDKMPLFCTGTSTICLWIRNGIVYGQYGNTVVNSTSPINTEVWTSLVFIYDESGEYTVFCAHLCCS